MNIMLSRRGAMGSGLLGFNIAFIRVMGNDTVNFKGNLFEGAYDPGAAEGNGVYDFDFMGQDRGRDGKGGGCESRQSLFNIGHTRRTMKIVHQDGGEPRLRRRWLITCDHFE